MEAAEDRERERKKRVEGQRGVKKLTACRSALSLSLLSLSSSINHLDTTYILYGPLLGQQCN